MNARLFVDRGAPFVTISPETLTDGSTVWNIEFRDGQSFHPPSERTADEAFRLIAEGIRRASGGDVLIL